MRDLFGGPTKCLLVQTKFSAFSFWNYQDVCDIVGAKYPAAPLGLLTVAALLPQQWIFKLIDENVEPLLDEQLLWADIVCTGGMLPQQKSMLEFIGRAHELERLVVVGGPDPTSQPDLYKEADFLVLGEGEITIPMFLRDLEVGITSGTYHSTERANMLESVIPRYDLIRFRDYIMIGMQFIRGCPFNCEFCDVIELFGRTPRFKTNEQILRELQTLYDLGYRGHIDMVDDNFIGNKKKVKELLREIKAWTKARKYPFYFTTEASVNLADDDELLQLMQDCDFRYVFLGIETPENDALAQNNKNQNVNKPIEEAVNKILSYGMVSNGGYIIGFDSESRQIASNMINSIQESGICMAMIGLLYALPNTQLTRRLETEGRLFHLLSQNVGDTDIDQMTSGLNFATLIPRAEVLKNYIEVLGNVYDPQNYYKRVIYTGLKIRPKYRHKPSFSTWLIYMRSFLRVCREAGFSEETGKHYWKMFFRVIFRNPSGIEAAVNLAAMFIHFQKQRKYIITSVKNTLAVMENKSEEAFNNRMTGKSIQKPAMVPEVHC
ncbi:MAG: B12-binding domain-containing radical SAM protein [Bacteroidetes bacterium]|nr:B12-binding domain-containing radical SAM protein [Bacteroidota bacterium]